MYPLARRSRLLAAALALALTLAALAAAGCGNGSGDTPTAGAGSTAAGGTTDLGLLKPGTISFGTDYSFPPLEYISGSEKAGLDPELAHLIAEQLGVTADLQTVSFQTAIPSLRNRKFDVVLSGLFITAERAKQVDFVPYLSLGHVVVARADDPDPPTQPEDLCGRTLAAQQGGFAEALALKGGALAEACGDRGAPKVHSFPTAILAYQDVAAGRSDGTIDVEPVARYLLDSRGGLTNLRITSPPGSLFYPIAVGMAVRKDDPQLKAALTRALARLEQSGELGKLLDRYGADPASPAVVDRALSGS